MILAAMDPTRKHTIISCSLFSVLFPSRTLHAFLLEPMHCFHSNHWRLYLHICDPPTILS